MPDSKTRTRPRTTLLLLAAGLILGPAALQAAGDETAASEPEKLEGRIQREIKEGRTRIQNLEDSLKRLASEFSEADRTSNDPSTTAELQTLREQLYLARGLQDVWYTMRERVRQGHSDINALEAAGDRKDSLRLEYDRLIVLYVETRMAEILARRQLAVAFTDESRTEAEEILTLREAQATEVRSALRRFLLENSLEDMEARIY